MKNIEIIAMNTALLIENGTIKPENEINTFIGWKMRGYKIKKGATHIAEFAIWKKDTRQDKPEDDKEETEKKPKKKRREYNLVTAYWFTDEQVEPDDKKNEKA